jgi:hypothetical protein
MRSARLLALVAVATGIIGGCVAGAGPSAVAPTPAPSPSVVPTVPPPSVVFVHPASETPDPGTPYSAPSDSGPYTTTEFWQYLAPCCENVFHFDSLAALTRGSDAVVVGTITGMRVEADRYKGQNLGPGGLVITMTLKIEQALAGTVNEFAPGEINLDVYVADSSQYDRFAAGIPNERAIFFLLNEYTEATQAQQPHLPNDKLYYLIIDDQALIRDVSGTAVPANPLDDFPVGGTVAGRPFPAVIASIETAGRS